jgi:ribosome maturation factor RimP
VEAVRKGGIEDEVRRLALPVVTDLGLEIVDTVFGRRGHRWYVRVDIDRAGTEGVRLEDCERVSGALEAALDESGVVEDAYVLEVSSPGLDRPIRTDDDVRRNTGRAVVVETREPIDGRRSFRGVLLGADRDAFRLREAGGETRVPRSLIVKAHQEIGFK